MFRLGVRLEGALPPGWEIITAIDLDLQLAPPDAPGTVRRPDLIVVAAEARQRVRREGGVLRASDDVHKRGEYADAGIQHYWIIDGTEPVSLVACHLAGEFGYADGADVTGRFSATEPFPVEIDLDALI